MLCVCVDEKWDGGKVNMGHSSGLRHRVGGGESDWGPSLPRCSLRPRPPAGRLEGFFFSFVQI